jgi:anti-sigma B factor antagonist
MLNFTRQQVIGTHVLKFQGSLDALTVPDVRPQVEALMTDATVRLVVDLTNVTTIDSSGVALIVSMFKRLRSLGGSIRIAGLQGQPREIFHFLRLDQSLPMSVSVDEALAGL